MGVGGWGVLGGEAYTFTPLLSLLLPRSLSGRGCECVGNEGPGAFASAERISLCFWGSRSVPLSRCHCNSRRLTSDRYGFMAAHRSTPTMPKGPDCHWAPTRGYPSLLLWNLRCLRLCGVQFILYLPVNPSVHVPLIRGPFPRSFPLFSFSSLSLRRSVISGNRGSFLSSRSLALAVSPSYTRCSSEYSERRQMSQIHHLRDEAVMEKSQGTYEWGMWADLSSLSVCVCACVCVCVSLYASIHPCTCMCVSVFQGVRVYVCVFVREGVSVSLLCAYACVEVTAGQHIVPQMFDILCIRGWLEQEDKHVPDRGISPPQSATSAM